MEQEVRQQWIQGERLMAKYRESKYKPSNYKPSEYNKERQLTVKPKGWSITEKKVTGGKIPGGKEGRVEVKETKVEPKATPESDPVKTTTSSSSGEDRVRELWGKNMPPPDLERWVSNISDGAKKTELDDGSVIWQRDYKDKATVRFNKEDGFDIVYYNDNPSGSSDDNGGLGAEP